MIRLFKHYIPNLVLVLGLADLFLLVMASELAWQLRAHQIDISAGPLHERAPQVFGLAFTIWIAMIGVDSYGPVALRSLRYTTGRLMVAVSLGILAISLLDFIVPNDIFWRSILFYAMVFSGLLVLGNRIVFSRVLGEEAFRRHIVVLGAGDRACRLLQLSRKQDSSFAIAAFVAMEEDRAFRQVEAVPRGSIADLGRFVAEHGASEVVLAMEERRKALPLKDLLRAKTRGVRISDFSSLIERETGRVDLDTLNPSWLIFSDGFSSARALSRFGKRMFDIAASFLLLLLTFPLILLFAILVKLESRGPAFYRQVRVGLYGQHFELFKLRSMRADAETGAAKWAEKDDPRITRIGKFIRVVRIDELPQAWNVLKGEMSFVGPRPERPEFVAELEQKLPYYAERHIVKPGITGWAQINYPYGASMEDAREKLEYDLYYAKNYTPFLDFLILLQTMRVILWPEGAR